MKTFFKPTFKSFLLLLLLGPLTIFRVNAAYLENIPTIVTNPDGTEIHCLASGDEFFNYLHDENGFTIIQGDDGFYYYGISKGDVVVPSEHRVGSKSPIKMGLKPKAMISEKEYQRRVAAFWDGAPKNHSKAPHTGVMNNIVIYIRFSDDAEFTTQRSVYDGRLNKTDGPSMKHYFQEVSYNQLTIESHHFPVAELTTNLSYVDIHPRSYFQPYHATQNPNGYNPDNNERRIREHALLQRAIQAVESEIPEDLILDADSDGLVDNVCFIIRGNAEGWSDLLWAHRWVLYTYDVQIHGKRVWDYTFQPENQTDIYVLAHEMFHTLSAPDLYRYSQDGFTPVGPWDLMASGFVHMGAHMKWKYAKGNWISDIPTISEPGEYNLNPLSSNENNAFRINSPYSSTEFFVVEYRKKEGMYESNLPTSGLLVYRIDISAGNGNAQGPPDEVYLYRPNGTLTANGNITTAALSLDSGNMEINDGSNPSSFLSNGSSGGLIITNVSEIDETISFTLAMDKFILSLLTNPSNGGVAWTKTGNNPYEENDEATITAEPVYGFEFVNWTDTLGNVVSSDETFTYTMPASNVTLIANFNEKQISNASFTVNNQHDIMVGNATIAVSNENTTKLLQTAKPIIQHKAASPKSFACNVSKMDVLLVTNKDANPSQYIKPNSNKERGEWIHWDNGVNSRSVGTQNNTPFSISSRWEAEDLSDYDGALVSKISFFPRIQDSEYTIKIWIGEDATEVYSQAVTNFTENQWNTIELDIPFRIIAQYDHWFGIQFSNQSGSPAGADSGPAISGKGDMLKFGDAGNWISINLSYDNFDLNWNIQVYVDDAFVKNTNSDGLANFTIPAGEYNYTVEKQNYEPFSSTFVINESDLDIDVTLVQLPTYSVTFTVQDSQTTIEGAKISFNGVNYTTDNNGVVAINDVDPETYAYTVNKSDYHSVSGEIVVDNADVSKPVSLTPVSVSQIEYSDLVLYPNPFSNTLNLKNLKNAKSITITNVIGQRVLHLPINDDKMVINTESLPRGIYLLTIHLNNYQKKTRKVIKN